MDAHTVDRAENDNQRLFDGDVSDRDLEAAGAVQSRAGAYFTGGGLGILTVC
jgi:hypothetical protein